MHDLTLCWDEVRLSYVELFHKVIKSNHANIYIYTQLYGIILGNNQISLATIRGAYTAYILAFIFTTRIQLGKNYQPASLQTALQPAYIQHVDIYQPEYFATFPLKLGQIYFPFLACLE